MKDRSDKSRSYSGDLMNIGGPGEMYIMKYLQREYATVIPVGQEKRRRDYRCLGPNGIVHLNEGKTDTMIHQTKRVPWEVLRIEERGHHAYISWGYRSECYRVIYFVPQALLLLDVRVQDVQRLIFRHIMARGGEVFIRPALTDSDRITFNFLVPVSLLKQEGVVVETEVAQVPLGPAVPYQPQLARIGEEH